MEKDSSKEMSCTLTIQEDRLVLTDGSALLTGAHASQLFYWGFRSGDGENSFVCEGDNLEAIVQKMVRYFSRHELPLVVSDSILGLQRQTEHSNALLQNAKAEGTRVKSGAISELPAQRDFLTFAASELARPLKQHQLKAAVHFLTVHNGANFSVPGSGKTSVVLAVFQWLRSLGAIDALFVVGPPSSFGPWKSEYYSVIGNDARAEILAGGDIENRRSKYYVGKNRLSDLYLTTYQTLQRDWERVKFLFDQADAKFFLVLDEAHYIKQLDGIWANAVLRIGEYAKIRCVLTGTPFPQGYADAFNLFEVLWPNNSPITSDDRIRIQSLSKKNRTLEAAEILDRAISPLFYRVRKSDLGLAPQEFHSPIMIKMNRYEQLGYDAVVDRLKHLSKEDYFRDLDLRLTLRRGRMIRFRQAISYTKLLATAVDDYDEELLDEKLSLAQVIKNYDKLESPAKLETLLELVESLRGRDEKILIWSNFVGTLKLILERVRANGHRAELIFGETPTENMSVADELTREQIVAAFNEPAGGIDVLVANPAACAESISLHKHCAHAVYYDLSYSCAQYLQSLDRIHRVGGSEDKIAHYHFLQYANTLDSDILENVQRKAYDMSIIVDQDYPIYGLDMFSEDDELAAYDRIFG
jgi:SNF2 family DNA or RNA helicase